MKYLKIFAMVAVAAAFVAMPQISSAQTVADLQAQISALLAQIQKLQTQLAQMQGQPVTWCHDFNVNLKVGDSGSEVEALRIALKKEGFEISEDDDTFNEYVASAVSGFQEKYKDEILSPWNLQYGTGFVGSTTRAKLNSLYGCGVVPPPPPPPTCEVLLNCLQGYTQQCSGIDEKGCPICTCVPIGTPINQPPVISGVSGPTALNVGQTGTWTIKASDPEQGNLSYSVDWGEPICAGLNCNPVSSTYSPQTYIQTATFTHSYSQASIYYLKFIVTDNQGLSAKTSISVNVGGATTTCTDSDGGKDYYVKGSAKDSIGQSFFTDYCYSSVGLNEAYCVDKVSGGAGPDYFAYTCPNGCSNGACIATTTPSITVLSPNGGESWEIGKSYDIYWKPNLLDSTTKVHIVLEKDGLSILTIAENINVVFESGLGLYNWKIGNEVLASGNYKIKVAVTGLGPSDTSDAPFSIVAATTTPSITVLSPNGGEQISNAGNYTLSYNINNLSANFNTLISPQVKIELLQNDVLLGQIRSDHIVSVNNTYSYPWNVGSYYDPVAIAYPQAQPGSGYKIKTTLFSNNQQISTDTSDAAFSIVAAGVGQSSQLSQMANVLESMKTLIYLLLNVAGH